MTTTMARHSKQALINQAVTAIEADGWTVTPLSPPGQHPARFTIDQDGVSHIVRLYIWNLSHGGKSRSASEYRIQVTGVDQFEPEPDGRTLILGWSDQFGVFAGFDVHHRTGSLGSSPSIQITATTLQSGDAAGAALQDKRKGEWAIAFRPDKLGRYIQHHAAAHAGNLDPLLAEDDSLAADPLASEILNVAEGSADFDLNAVGQDALLSVISEDVEKIRAALHAADPGPAPMGHNQPPGPIDDEPTLAQQIDAAAVEIQHELSSQAPDAQKIGRAGALLAWAGRILVMARKEGAKVWDKAKDIAREHMVKALWGGGGLATIFKEELVEWLRHVGGSILRWLQHIAVL